MPRKSDHFHTPSERKNKKGQTAYMYCIVRIVLPGDKKTTASFSWMDVLQLRRKARWNPGEFRQKVRDVLYDLVEAGELDLTKQISPQLWDAVKRVAG